MVVHRGIALTNVFGDNQISRAVVIRQTLRDQERCMGEVSRKIGIDVVAQLLRGTASVCPLDFLQNILPQQLNGLSYMKDGEVRLL